MKVPSFSLRTRLFLGFGSLVVLFVLAQVWLVRSLTQELGAEVDHVALEVGNTVAEFFTYSSHVALGDGEANARALEEMIAQMDGAEQVARSEGETEIWVWSPTTNQLIEAPGHEVRVVIPGSATAMPVDSEDTSTQRPEAEDDSAHSADDARLASQDLESSGQSSSSFEFHSSHGVSHIETHVETLSLPSGHEAQVHLSGDLDARVLLLERPNLRAEVPIPRLGLREKLDRFQQRLWLGSGLLLIFGLLVAGIASHRISTPLADLADAAEQVGGGALGVQVASKTGGLEIRRTLGAFNEMSSRLEKLDQRNRSLEALRHLEEIGDIARGLAHSLRNPLNALGLSVEQLANKKVGDERRVRLVETAGRQVKRLDAGIRSFLVLASPGEEAGIESVTLGDLVRDVALEALQDAGGRVGVEVDLAHQGEGVEEARGDADGKHLVLPAVVAELRAVVQALVVNAVEASPDGERVRVRLSALPSPESGAGARALLEVEDRGSGLSAEVRDRLFTPHVSTKPNGSGMGLFLAQRIAGFRYGGRLELLDRVGGGTLARLELGARRRFEDGGDVAGDFPGEEG